IDSLKSRSADNPIEIAILKDFLQKYLNTVEILRLKYLFQQDDKMAIDLTDSSFPNYLEIKKLDAEALKSRETLAKMPNKDSIKQEVLDYMFERKAQPIHLLQKMGEITYNESLINERYMKMFTEGSLHELGKTKAGHKKYLYSWASYDSMTNRPYIYILAFEFTNDSVNLQKEGLEAFKAIIEKNESNSSPLKVLATDLDNSAESIKPKILKRIDIGPIYCKYSKENHEISKTIQEKFTEDDFAFFYTTEIVNSVGEKEHKTGGIFSSEKQLRQVFFVDETDIDSLERHVSEVNKYLIGSHKIVQYLTANKPNYVNNLKIPAIVF
ncbi:MAG: hypothetical protein ABF242_00440, partial [Flavobacteriales bacterium]